MKKIWKNLCLCLLVLVSSISFFACKKDNKSMSVDLDGMGQILFAVISIGVITFILSAIGVKIGNIFGSKYKFLAELSGGIVLVIMGLKILLEHIGILG